VRKSNYRHIVAHTSYHH